MEKLRITEETIENARDYVSLAEKKEFIDECAAKCFDRMEITADAGESVVLPPMYKENPFLRQRYLYGALARLYFGVEYERECPESDMWLMSVADYDKWCGSHIFNQLERLKSHVSVSGNKDKIFDILADYRDFEKKFSAEIYALCAVMNEPVTRLLASIQATATPENMQEALASLTRAKDALVEYAAQKGGENNGGK